MLVSELASEDRELTRQHLAAERLRLLMLSENHLPQYRPLTDQQILRKDELSTRLLQSQNPLILDTYVPIFTTADGNCLFRAVSMLCYGTEDHHELLRLLCACEVILHPHMYNRDSSFLYEPFRNAKYLSVPSMDNVIDELLRHGRQEKGYVGVVSMLAASCIIHRPITMFYPLTSEDGIYSEYNQTLVGRDVNADEESISVLWTTTEDREVMSSNAGLKINHFAALVTVSNVTRPTDSTYMETDTTEGE